MPTRKTVFTNAQLVGREGTFSVVVDDGIVVSISEHADTHNAEVVDVKDKWLSPVSVAVSLISEFDRLAHPLYDEQYRAAASEPVSRQVG